MSHTHPPSRIYDLTHDNLRLEALQAMAKTAQSKVVFVPMSLQTDINSQMARGGNDHMSAAVAQESGEGSGEGGLGVAGRAGLLNSVSNM